METTSERINRIIADSRKLTLTEAVERKHKWEALCRVQNERHEADNRKAAVRVYPDMWADPDLCAALVRLGEMRLY